MEAKRIPPCPDYDIRGTEAWLEDMALKGYILCEGHAFQYGLAYFESGQPRRIRYRLTTAAGRLGAGVLSPNGTPEEPDEETRELHSQFGWEYTTYRGQFWIFRCEDPDAPEMNTDPRVQAIALEVAEKRLREHLFWLLMYGVMMIASRSDLFCTTLVKYGIGHYWTIPIFLILACIAWLPGVLHIIRFRRELKRGHFPENTTYLSPAKAHAQFIARFLPFFWLIYGMWTTSQHIPRYGDSLTPEDSAELPLVTVADLFPEAQVEYISSSNYIYEWETDCAPDCTDLAEHFRLTLPDGSTATGVWSLSRYETAFDWIAAGCARETRLLYWLRGGTKNLDVALPEADWFRVFHVDNPDRYRYAHDVILIQKDTVFIECSLTLFEKFPAGPTPEELARLLLETEG